jgi:hypothetical protein
MFQLRGSQESGADKFRITVELVQVVLHYFDSEKDPVGVQGRTFVIFPGVHARLSNISEAGTFIEDEEFEYQGVHIQRKAGASARGLMRSFVTLRKKHPDMFQGMDIMQQPAAYLDGVIHQWRLLDLQSLYPQTIWQRDALRTTFTEEALKSSAVCHQTLSLIQGKMTPVLQLTDTDFAFLFKAKATNAKERLKMDLKAKAKKEGTRESWNIGLYPMMKIISEALKGLEQETIDRNLVLAGLRRNGMLAYRPNVEKKFLYPLTDEEWVSKLPFQSHRLKAAWCKDRLEWRDEEGVPARPEYKNLKNITRGADIAEEEYCAAEEAVVMNIAGQDFTQIHVDISDLGAFEDEACS